MKIKIISDTNETLQLKISDIDVAFANALRRIMIADTKCWAIDTVDFEKIQCLMTMEELAHRLGLLPIVCNNENTPIIKLDIKPEITTTVYAKDLNFINCSTPYPDMPLVILKKNQGLKFTCNLKYTSKNIGGHAKWSPATVVFYNIVAPNVFLFTIETTGVISPKELFSQAIDILEEKFKNVSYEEIERNI